MAMLALCVVVLAVPSRRPPARGLLTGPIFRRPKQTEPRAQARRHL
jgi:hypothetical protein